MKFPFRIFHRSSSPGVHQTNAKWEKERQEREHKAKVFNIPNGKSPTPALRPFAVRKRGW